MWIPVLFSQKKNSNMALGMVMSVCCLDHFGPDWNISTTTRWIAIWNFVQIFMVPRGWILLTLVSPWLFLWHYQQATVFTYLVSTVMHFGSLLDFVLVLNFSDDLRIKDIDFLCPCILLHQWMGWLFFHFDWWQRVTGPLQLRFSRL